MTSTTMKPLNLNLSEDQLSVLENSFKNLGRHPDGSTLMLIAAECGLTVEETQVGPLICSFFFCQELELNEPIYVVLLAICLIG